MKNEYTRIWREIFVKIESEFPKKFSNYIMSWNIYEIDYFNFTQDETDYGVETLYITEWADVAQINVILMQEADSEFNTDFWAFSSNRETNPLDVVFKKSYNLTEDQVDLLTDALSELVRKLNIEKTKELQTKKTI